MPSERSVEGKRSLFSGFPGFKSKDKNRQKKDAEQVVEDLERSLTKDDPLIENNTFNEELDDVDRKNSKNKFREETSVDVNEDDDDDEDKENVVNAIMDPRKRRSITWSSDVTFFEQSRSGSVTQLLGDKPARPILKKAGSSLRKQRVPVSALDRDSGPAAPAKPFGPNESSASKLSQRVERPQAGSGPARPSVDPPTLSNSTPSVDSINSKESVSGSFDKLKGMLFVKLGPPRSCRTGETRRRLSETDKEQDGNKRTASVRSASDRSLHLSDLDTSLESLHSKLRSLFGEKRQSEDELKKDSVRQEEETPIDDGRGPKVATRKKRKVPKLKLNRFRKKNKRPTDSATEELVSSPAEDEAERPAASDRDTEAEDGVDRPGTSGQGTEQEEGNADSAEEPSQPVPAPRTLPAPTLVKTARPEEEEETVVQDEAQREETQDEVQRMSDAGTAPVRLKPVKKKRRRKRGPKRPEKTPPLDGDDDREETSIPTLEGDEEDEASASGRQDNEDADAGSSVAGVLGLARKRRRARAAIRDDSTVLGVTVHSCDHLRVNFKYISHPLVRVSIVDGATGQYLQKSERRRKVTSNYESDDVGNILPIMTQPFDFRANQSILPRWEETLVFNDCYHSVLRSCDAAEASVPAQDPTGLRTVNPDLTEPSPIIFFVIRDFVSMTKANNVRRGKDDVEKGWYNVAWAFLKLVGANGHYNTGRRARLQLYKPPRQLATVVMETQDNQEPAYLWWKDHARQRYPSTLYVTAKAVNRPGVVDPAMRSMLATQAEAGSGNDARIRFADGTGTAEEDEENPKWSRLPGQVCKIPNTVSLRLWTGSDGAFSVRFSNRGTRLAVACKHDNSYPILLYSIPRGGEMGCLNGHQQLVYDIRWSRNDDRVVSASADGTAQVWDLKDKSKATHTLPHSAYVYTAAFHPTAEHIVVTGGYDCAVRVWNVFTSTAQMLQELVGHRAFVNSLVFDQSGLTMYSVDSGGLILAWNCMAHEKPRKDLKISWTMKTKFEEREISGICVNNIEVHPRNNKLLLHCRDSVIRMLDVRIHAFLRFSGSTNHRKHLRSTLTACGSFVLSGSEDGCVYVWNADTGDQVAIYNELGFAHAVRDVTFHPHEHMVAFCCFSPNMPVLVYKYDKSVAAIGTGLAPLVESSKPGPSDSIREGMDLGNAGRGTAKVDRIKQQLDSVLVPSRDPSPLRPRSAGPSLSPRRYDPYGASDLTWGSTFDSSQGTSAVEPSFLSPHASPGARALGQHLAATLPKSDTGQGWRPTFAAVGGSPYRYGAGPDVTVAIDDQGNKSLRVKSPTPIQHGETVVALYDYRANRSDELTIRRNDVIKLLYKDGESWWFGEMMDDGRQGYFPSNYVALNDDETVEEKLELRERQPEVMFGVPEERPESAESETARTIHALKMPSGKIHFYAQSESEEEGRRSASTSLSSRQRRRDQRSTKSFVSASIHQEPSTSLPEPSTVETEPTPSTTDDVTPSPKTKPRKKSPRSSKPLVARELPPLSAPRSAPRSSKMEIVDLAEEEDIEPSVSLAESQQPSSSIQRVKFKDTEDLYTVPHSSKKRIEENAPPTSVESDPVPAHQSYAESTNPSSRPRFGVLEAVKQKLAENDSLLSKTVVGGAEFSRDETIRSSRGPLPGQLDPILTSTASRSKKSRSRAKRSTSRGRTRPKLLVTGPSQDDDEIPMVGLGGAPYPESGTENPAYDETSDV